MSKATMKKLIGFLKMLKAPVQLLPFIVSFVIALVNRVAQGDDRQSVRVEQQGFVCRRSNQIIGGCGSPSVAPCADGSAAAVFACSRVVDNVLVNSLCLTRISSEGVPSGAKTFLLSTPLHLGSVTATQTPSGLLVKWQIRKNTAFRAPSCFSQSEALSLKNNTAAAAEKLSDTQKQDGTYYAFVSGEGKEFDKIYKAPEGVEQGAVALGGNELLWLGVEQGRAVANFSADCGKSFSPVGTVPALDEGRTYNQVSGARLQNGRLIAVMNSAGELFISYSDDMGKKWSRPKPLHTHGTDPNLFVRDDGAMALCYVVRDKAFPVRCRVSSDGQYIWGSERIVVASAGEMNRRPYTAQLGGSFLTVSRQRFCGEKESSIIFTQWQPHSDDFCNTKAGK